MSGKSRYKHLIHITHTHTHSHTHIQTHNHTHTHTHTQKHSLVCALCLGWEDILGFWDAKDVKEFVRFGMKKAFIEITLHDDEPNVISRVITRDNKSQFKLNGKNVSKAKILELVASYVFPLTNHHNNNNTNNNNKQLRDPTQQSVYVPTPRQGQSVCRFKTERDLARDGASCRR